jgi:hypothetical protein
MDFKGAEKYIIEKLSNELPHNLYYHNIEHTLSVYESVKMYAVLEKVDAADMILIKTAALYHDSGFLIRYRENEICSVQIIEEVLPEFDYTEIQIEAISKMIMSTEIPNKPKNLLDKILCDADLDYLGTNDFFMRGMKLFKEWNDHGIVTSLKEWYYQELYFLQQHEFFTKSAIKLRQNTKMKHLAQVKELLGEND